MHLCAILEQIIPSPDQVTNMNHYMYKDKKAFTLLEVIFVIIILGIVSSIGSSIIVQVYESYIIQRAVHNASLKSELAINQIANRLLYRVDKSMLARKPLSTGFVLDTDVYPVSDVPLTNVNDYTALEWIGYENDGFSMSFQPGWSGFCDLNTSASTYASISTTGSKLTDEATVLNNLAGGTADKPAIIFTGSSEYRTGGKYAALCMYRNDGCIFPVNLPTANTTLTFSGEGNRTAGQMIYSEFYQLLASAYAVVPENEHTVNGVTVWDLMFYSNYQPWLGENHANGTKSLLAKDVSVFRFKQESSSIRIKLCTVSQLGDTEQVSTCKEKAVIR